MCSDMHLVLPQLATFLFISGNMRIFAYLILDAAGRSDAFAPNRPDESFSAS